MTHSIELSQRKITSRIEAATESIKSVTDGLKNTERGLLLSIIEGKATTNYCTATAGRGYGTHWAGKRLSFRAYRNAARALVKKGLIRVDYEGPAKSAYCYGDEDSSEIGAGWHFYRPTYYLRATTEPNHGDSAQRSSWVDATDTQMAAWFLSDASCDYLNESHFYYAFRFEASPELLALHSSIEEAKQALRSLESVTYLRSEIAEAEEAEADPIEDVRDDIIRSVATAQSVREIEDAVRAVLANVTTPEQVERQQAHIERMKANLTSHEQAVEEYLAA